MVPARPGLDERVLVAGLRALDPARELRIVHQAVVDPRTGWCVGAEALLRWELPDGTAVPCDTFIPLAEELGLLPGIGRWVLRTACAEAAQWAGRPWLGVNASPCELAMPGFADEVLAAAMDGGLAPHRLMLEITESGPVRSTQATRDNVEALCRAGVNLALDDFGTGHANLTSLALLPVGTIKIDQSFVTAAERPGVARTVISHVVGLAEELGALTIAEGVQTEAQREIVIDLGCELAQGWLFAAGVEASRMAQVFDSQSVVPAQRMARKDS